MIITQISIFIENKKGRIADIMAKLEESGINIKALCLADTENFGILRIIADGECDTKKISALNIAASQKDVLRVYPSDEFPISKILGILAKSNNFVEYMYACDGLDGKSAGSVIICVSDEKAGEAALKKAGYVDA